MRICLSGLSRLPGSDVSNNRQHILSAQLGYHRFHQASPFAVTRALLDVGNLAHEIAGRAARNSRHGAQTPQIPAMANPTRSRLASAAVRDQGFTLLETAHRHVRDEAGACVAKHFGCSRIHWCFYDAL